MRDWVGGIWVGAGIWVGVSMLCGIAGGALAGEATGPGPATAPATAPANPEAAAFFETRVRPVLADRCYRCHSAAAQAAGKLKGDLFLDTRDGVRRGGKNGPALVPGKPSESRLVTAIHWTDPDLQMPPKEKLSPTAIADLEKWVAMGAPDPREGSAPVVAKGIDIEAGRKFWSFQPLHVVPPPEVKRADWARSPIDRFVLAKMEEKGLEPNTAAARSKLIRRAYLDLLGVPPAPADVTAFVTDASADAYEKLIDRLLASPQYGERWARHWLDVARFAESDGFEHDSDRPAAYQYRDFVIRALNQDMPFDRFVQWQVAGDELAPNDWQAMAATGFLSAGVFPTQITEKEFEFTRYSQLDDMVSTTGSAMLGLTVGCARCHDHKFDPISQRDYYRMVAAFTTAIRSDVEVDLTTPAERERFHRENIERVAAARAKVDAFEKLQLPERFGVLLQSVRQNPDAVRGVWSVLGFEGIKTANGTRLVPQDDGSLLKVGQVPATETYTLTTRTPAVGMTALRVQALADKSLPQNGPGAAPNGNFALTEIEVLAAAVDGSQPAQAVKIISASTTHQQNDSSLSVASSFDGRPDTGWAVDVGGIGKSQAAIFKFDKPVGFPGGTLLTITLHFDHPSRQHLIGRTRLSIATNPDPKDFGGQEGPTADIVDTLTRLATGQPVDGATEATARKWFASTLPDYQKLLADASQAANEQPKKNTTRVQVTSEGLPPVQNYADGRGYPHFYPTVYLLRRGDTNNKMEPVTEAFPAVLMRDGKNETYWQQPPPAGVRTSYRRTALARWMTDTQCGAGQLVARVIVNRVWQHHLGRGIVATPNDFGVQGERPTHPELLDWLADDLISHGWQLKRLHKLMMTSAVFMQDSKPTPKNLAIDPHDVYQWRWEPRRLEAEPSRDSLLAAAGQLDPTMFGPGTLDSNTHRRSIYFTVKRSQLIPMMMVLDWPEALNSLGVRPSTTVAPQALLFMNSPQARQYAAGFASRVAGSTHPVEQAYLIAFARQPTAEEAGLATAFIDSQSKRYTDDHVGDPHASAMTDFCQALLSANEFLFVE